MANPTNLCKQINNILRVNGTLVQLNACELCRTIFSSSSHFSFVAKSRCYYHMGELKRYRDNTTCFIYSSEEMVIDVCVRLLRDVGHKNSVSTANAPLRSISTLYENGRSHYTPSKTRTQHRSLLHAY